MKKAKKSGFTMIEMLATILVLLVVVLIATPSIRRMVTNSDELSKSYTEELVLDAARDYATINNKEVTKDLKIVGNYTIISLETLKNIGLIEEEDITKLGVDARVKVTLEEDLYVKFEIVYDSLLTEDIKPTIILLGEDPYYLLQGKVYVDPGYVAFDRHGNTITDLVVVTGTVNKDVIGTYTLTYSLTDNEGNVGDPVTRVVNVVDSTYPAVTVAIAESNNIYHNKFVRNSETVTLNLTFSKIVTDPTVLIGGRTATVTGSGNTRVATYEIPEFESLLVSQALSVLVKDYEDIYENEGIEATNVTSGGLVVYDNIKPLITSTTIISNNTFNKYAKNGHIITMTTNFTEPVRSLTSTIHGRTPTTTNGLNTSTVTKTYTIPVAESTLVQGDVVGLITEYMDRAGNIGISNDIRLSGGTVVYDRTAPVCGTWTPNPSPWKASGTQTFTLASSTDVLSGINVAGGPCTTGSAHGNTCTVTISDRSLNTLVCTSPINRVDTTPPAVTTHNPTSRDWAYADVSVAIGGGADAESGFLRREYCYTTNGTFCTPSTTGNSVTFTATGQYTLCSRAVDNVNNLSTPTTCSVANAYKIDKTIPTYTSFATTPTPTTIALSIAGVNEVGSGISSYKYYLNGSLVTTSASSSYTYTGLAGGTTYTVSFEIIDAVGNIGSGSRSVATTVNVPTSLAATGGTTAQGQQITVSWNANSNPAGTTYVVYSSTDNVTFSELGTTTSTSYVQGSLATSTTMYYKVKARSATLVESAQTSSVSGNTLGSPTFTAISRTGTVNSGLMTVSLSWNAVTGAAGYRIWIFDGRAYRSRDLGNVTSWNSDTAKIYPTAAQISAWSGSTDPFRWSGDGTSFSSNMNPLYLKANGSYTTTTYYSWIHVAAYDANSRASGGVWAGATSACAANPDTDRPTKPTVTLRYDSTSGAIYPSGTWTNRNIYQIQSSSDVVGVTSYQYSHDNVNFSAMPTNWGITWGGNWNFYVRALDAAGNYSVSSDMYTLRIDKTKPTCSVAKSNIGTTTGVTATVTAGDTGGSGYSSGAGTFNNITATKIYTVYDAANNSGTCSITVTPQTQYQSNTCSAYTTCKNAACGYASCATAGCGNLTCRTSGCGVELYNSCANAACGYKSCSTSGCGNLTCRTAACGVQSYNYCANAACGYKTCANAACGYKTCTSQSCCGTYCNTSGKIYECYQLVGGYGCGTRCATSKPSTSGQVWYITSTTCCVSSEPATCSKSCCGNATCATSACGNLSCYTSACGVALYNSCANAACGYVTCANSACGNLTCRTAGCGVQSYNSCANAACGYKTCANAACGYATCANSACGCTTWGGWTGWTTTACSVAANVRQCNTRYIYN